MTTEQVGSTDHLLELRSRLQHLYLHAGEPSYREIARRTGTPPAVSHATVAGVMRCTKVPSWGALELVVEVLGGSVEDFRLLRASARENERTMREARAPAPKVESDETNPGSSIPPSQLALHEELLIAASRRFAEFFPKMLDVVTELERAEKDPRVLSQLFKLDHLVTVMRRRNEGFAVVGGMLPTFIAERPVQLVDIFRAALSEIEEYIRCEIRFCIDVLISEPAVSPLITLIAELLENAVLYSPPTTQVQLSSEELAGGSILVTITNRSSGISDRRLSRLNARIMELEPVQSSLIERMGLAIVGRLASTIGCTVQLRRGRDELEIVAEVTIPRGRLAGTAESVATSAN